MNRNFLLEIGTEELPAGCLGDASEQLKNGLLDLLGSKFLLPEVLKSYYEEICKPGGKLLQLPYPDELKIYYTPRRLAVLILNIPDTQEDKKIEVLGPPKELSFNPDGTMTQAAIGFANSQGVPVESIKTKAKGKKEVICCEKTVTGKPTIEILKSALPDIIKNIKFKKSMKWEPTGVRFARPIRWFVALFGEDIIEFELAGVKSGKISQGLRGDIPITIDIPDKYEQLLEEKGIIPDPEKRKIHTALYELGYPYLDSPDLNNIIEFTQKEKLKFMCSYELIEEVTNLVESPKVILCEFDKKYLDLLPPEIIITAMQFHQRYFTLCNQESKLSNYFIAVANTKEGDVKKIKEGYENVLKGRLEDAEFFYNEDLKTPLENRVEKLKSMVWQAGLGSLYDKTQRLVILSEYITTKYNFNLDLPLLKKSVALCKADLAANMIKDGKEFTSLEGLYGTILAEKQHIDKKIVNTLKCRFLPDICDVQKFPEGVLLAIVDRLDTIVGAFILDKIPTGSSDPLGIKRAGNELIEIIIKNKLDISINRQLINKIKEMYASNIQKKDTDNRIKESDFFYERIKKYLEDKRNIRYDIIRAVLSKGDIYISDPAFMDYNPFNICERAVAFYHSIANQEFPTLIMLAKRIRNILKSPELKIQSEIKETVLQEPEEKELFKAIEKKQVFDKYVENKDYVNALKWLLDLAPLINNFFDKILIMAEDINLRNNRLALINLVNSSFEKIADFSQIAE
ncbi:MAG: glycine--tRNA ligase subunit beta [bacterium]|nr:glycine--tRNA ligase subunit beta [bacterium]